MRASAIKYGRSGPRTVLKPAHPTESAFSMICSRQQLLDSRPATATGRSVRINYRTEGTTRVVAARADCARRQMPRWRMWSLPRQTVAQMKESK